MKLRLIQFYAFIGLICLGCGNETQSDRPPLQPNILFIAVDDLRPQLHAYGEEYMVTPNMDRLAAQGRLFRHHYVTVPTCGPSRYAILTGRYPRTTGQIKNSVFEELTADQPPQDQPESMMEAFRRQGYYTVGIGKISHAPDGFVYGYRDSVSTIRELPNSWDEFHFNPGKWGNGWNAFFGYADGENRQSMNNQVKPYEAGQVDDNGYPDGLTADLAVAKLAKLKERSDPFFLAVGFFKPHLPFNAPQKYWDLYEEDELPLSPCPDMPANTHRASFHNSGEFDNYEQGDEKTDLDHPVSDAYARKLRHGYFAAVSYVDTQVGKVLKALEESGLDNNTVVVLWGDHGWHLGDQRIWGKHTLSEYALRSALIIKTPQMDQPGQMTDAIVESTDIYPTLLDITGHEIPDYLEGQSLRPILEDPTAVVDQISYSYFRRGITMRNDRYRITKYFREEEPTVELYDYRSDPHETQNVAANHPDLVDSLLITWKRGDTGLYGE